VPEGIPGRLSVFHTFGSGLFVQIFEAMIDCPKVGLEAADCPQYTQCEQSSAYPRMAGY